MIIRIMARIFFTTDGFRRFCINMVPMVAPATPAVEVIASNFQSTVPMDQYVRNPDKDEKGTTKAVMVVIFFGLNPMMSKIGEIIPPPPIPSNPDNNPASVPISESEMYGMSSLNFVPLLFLKNRNMHPENTKKAMNMSNMTCAAMYLDAYAPMIAKRNEKTMIGIPILKSSRLFLILLILAPVKLMVL